MSKRRRRAAGPRREWAVPAWVGFISLPLGGLASVAAIGGTVFAIWTWPDRAMITGGGLVILGILISYFALTEAEPNEKQQARIIIISSGFVILGLSGLVMGGIARATGF